MAHVLEHRIVDGRMSQFLVSTKPPVSPHALVRSVKGRLQYLVRGERPKAFSEVACARSMAIFFRAGIVLDHVHLTLGGVPNQSPGEIAVGFTNNLAYRDGMKRVFDFGYYVGTFGEYDLGAVPWA